MTVDKLKTPQRALVMVSLLNGGKSNTLLRGPRHMPRYVGLDILRICNILTLDQYRYKIARLKKVITKVKSCNVF